MLKSAWKSAEELEYMLGNAHKVVIFSCGVCANLSDTGGRRGMRFMKEKLQRSGREVICAKTITACCSEQIMKQAVRIHAKALRECDALMVISCAGGIKSAFLNEPGIAIIPAADSVGSVPVSRRDDPVAHSLCTNCGHCVIAFCGGICPVSTCPARKKYEPCSRYRENGRLCVVDDSKNCVWQEIERRGNLEALHELARMHESPSYERMTLAGRSTSPNLLKSVTGWLVARAGWFARLVPFVN
jgi:hypothetical protein